MCVLNCTRSTPTYIPMFERMYYTMYVRMFVHMCICMLYVCTNMHILSPTSVP